MHKYFLLALIFISVSLSAQAQTEVTFNLNLKPMIEDSSFVPGQDAIQITGNLYPLGNNKYQLRDLAPIDSVYTVEITFSRRHTNQRLNYNFEIVQPREILKENNTRSLLLSGREIELPPLLFNTFAM